MSSGLSSDKIIKMEILETLGETVGDIYLRIFPESSRQDQIPIGEGGLTFGINGVGYGSCDAAWFDKGKKWLDGFNNKLIDDRPVIGLEGTDALNRGSSGNAQYQRFHHALGAVKNGLIGIYYLRKGNKKIQPDLYGMAYFATQKEKGTYIVTQDLSEVKKILLLYHQYGENSIQLKKYLDELLSHMRDIWYNEKFSQYGYDWGKFANNRSTIVFSDKVIKYAARNKRGFTDGSQRSGHIAVGEMYLTKYYFFNKKFYYLFPRFTHQDIIDLDNSKKKDKEWHLLRNEPGVSIKTMDDLEGLPEEFKKQLIDIKDVPLNNRKNKGACMIYSNISKKIADGLRSGNIIITEE